MIVLDTNVISETLRAQLAPAVLRWLEKASQAALFEDDYLLRELGQVAHMPQVALTELVANTWALGRRWRQVLLVKKRLAMAIENSGAFAPQHLAPSLIPPMPAC